MSEDRRGRASRRTFLKSAGATGAGLVAAGAGAQSADAAETPESLAAGVYAGSGLQNFTRMFPTLAPFASATATVKEALREVGKVGGILDAADDLGAGPVRLIVDPAVNGNTPAADPPNADNPRMTAGSTFVGQFIDHDVTFDLTSSLGQPQNPLTSVNTRSPSLDLDSVFGGGPAIRPDLYVRNSNGSYGPKMKIGTGGVHEDVPRVSTTNHAAVLGDPRNDEHIILNGLHCAHILFYNQVLDDLPELDLSPFPAARGIDLAQGYARFLAAREITLWHYQWLLVNEHLPQVVGASLTNDIVRNGGRFYRPLLGLASMPIEFGGAAYRVGHSMIRPSYRANFTSGTGPADNTSPTLNPFFGLIFDPNDPDINTPGDRPDLLGGYPAPRRYVGWQTFFDFGDQIVRPNKAIDTNISSPMFKLPVPTIAGSETSETSLPQRNLLRQLTWGLPSGQAVARRMGVTPLAAADLSAIGGVYGPFATSTPLWYYVLAEAEVVENGARLGPVGGRIVAETLLGLLRADPTSYLNVAPRFRPFLGDDMPMGPNPSTTIAGATSYTRAHFLYYAGVVQPGVYR